MSGPENFHTIFTNIESDNEIELNQPLNPIGIELTPSQHLISDLSGNCGALFVRSILFQLGIDESKVLKWRLENKFRQYQIMSHYAPDCMPHTFGLSEIMKQDNGVQKVKDLFSRGYFLKAALGDGSFATRSWDRTNEFENVLQQHSCYNEPFETYIVQKKLRLRREYRVHTFGSDVIPMLTYRVPNTQHQNYHQDAEQFVTTIIRSLPKQITGGTLIAWDIGNTCNGEYFVIETNFTGFHPEYRRGFQTTGYVDNHQYGPIICAWLNKYFYTNCGIYVDSVEATLLANYPFYKAFIYYSKVFTSQVIEEEILSKPVHRPTLIMYIGESSNIFMLNLLNHFLNVDLAKTYYVIVNPESFQNISTLFRRSHVRLINEIELVPTPQYKAFVQLDDYEKRQICSHMVTSKIKNEPYVII